MIRLILKRDPYGVKVPYLFSSFLASSPSLELISLKYSKSVTTVSLSTKLSDSLISLHKKVKASMTCFSPLP